VLQADHRVRKATAREFELLGEHGHPQREVGACGEVPQETVIRMRHVGVAAVAADRGSRSAASSSR
jgi:hypothetical protein